MRGWLALFLTLAAGCVAVSGPALADMDHACLTACVGQGNNTRSCLQKCSYAPVQGPMAKPITASSANNAFAPLQRYTEVTVAPSLSTQAPAAATPLQSVSAAARAGSGYGCVIQCVQSAKSYPYCRNACLR